LRVWRVCRRSHRAFDGEGARLSGGRWNLRGTRVVYTSATLSLAALEYFVNVAPDEAPSDLVAVPAYIPDGLAVSSVATARLPKNWRAAPAPRALGRMGTAWAREGKTAVLAVPSAVIPQERNYLLNPVHLLFPRIQIGVAEPFAFDPRIWKE
jgi:RES domain-containing protein